MVWLACRLVVLLLAIAPQGLHAAPPRAEPFAGPQQILKWINGYRLKPEPDKLPLAVRAMSAYGVFRDLEASGVYIGFMAGVLGDNPDKAEDIVARMFPIVPEDQVAIVRAIAYSTGPSPEASAKSAGKAGRSKAGAPSAGAGGNDDWKPLLRKFVERMPARKVLIQRHLDDKLPTLRTLPLEGQPAAIDVLWGYYFATGKMTAIDRLIDTLAWAKDADNLERLTTGSMVKWTMANNALQDKELLDHLKAEAGRRPKLVQTQLAEVVEAAETYETAKIRKAATQAIEELRRKGPETTRNYTFWGQAGQTALALGCVVAGALGHPEIAVPCVIGGAASSAALKVFTPQP